MSFFKTTNQPCNSMFMVAVCAITFAFTANANAQQIPAELKSAPHPAIVATTPPPPKIVAATPPAVVATTQPAISASATALEIQKINENMTMLQAQLNQLDLQVQVATKKRDLSGINGEAPGFSSFDAKKGNPSIVSVAGINGKLEAVLVFPGGATQRVKEGDVIDERKVTKVSRNEVVLTQLKGNKTQRLSFNTTAAMNDQTPNADGKFIVPGMNIMPQQSMAR